MRYYHVYTKGLVDAIIFRDREDYIAGMNLLAVAHFRSKVKILAFVLMSNHFHFVVWGDRNAVTQFINLYKKLVSRYILNRYGEHSFLKRVETSYDVVDLTNDGLKKLIAYVLNNPVKAGILSLPVYYPWGSASCYFSAEKSIGGQSVRSIGVRELRRKLHSNVSLPDGYLLNADGYISPSSYVDFGLVEQIYGRPKSFEYYLTISSSVKQMRKDVISFSDSIVMSAIEELLVNKYGTPLESLNNDMMKCLLNDLRRHFNCSSKQLARVTKLPLKSVLEAIG